MIIIIRNLRFAKAIPTYYNIVLQPARIASPKLLYIGPGDEAKPGLVAEQSEDLLYRPQSD